MELKRLSPVELPYFKRIYYDAFPKSEQKPMRFLLHSGKKHRLDLFLLRDRGENLGLTVTAPYRDLVLVYYLAVDPEKRGQGVGSPSTPASGSFWRSSGRRKAPKINPSGCGARPFTSATACGRRA